jgi:hypothetical protein
MEHGLAGLPVAFLGIVVGDDDHVGVLEMLAMLGLPFASASGVACGWNADGPKAIDVTFAFDDEHQLFERDLLAQLGQAIGNLVDAFDGPNPFAGLIGVGAALAEILGIEAAHLK